MILQYFANSSFKSSTSWGQNLVHRAMEKFHRPTSQPSTRSWVDPQKAKLEAKMLTYYNYALYGSVFGLCFLSVPLYTLFCQHVGISGDFKQKDYRMSDKQSIMIKNVPLHRQIKVAFYGEPDPSVNWEFQPIQNEIIINPGETALMFYRAVNKEPYPVIGKIYKFQPIIGFATYNIFPQEAQLYFSKIQCFCFNQQLLNPKEELQLPLYFYLEPEIVDDPMLMGHDEIRVYYRILKTQQQDMIQYVEEELQRVEKNKQTLKELRQKQNLTLGTNSGQTLTEDMEDSTEGTTFSNTVIDRKALD